MAVQESSTGCRLTAAEFETLRHHCYNIVSTIHPFQVARSLHIAGYIPDTVITTLDLLADDGKGHIEVSQWLLCHLPFFCHLQDFISILTACRYTDLAAELRKTYMTLCTSLIFVQRTTQRPKQLKFIEHYLHMIHTDKVLDPQQTFHELAEYNKNRMSEATDIVHKQALADRTVAMKCGEIYMLTITGEKKCKTGLMDNPLFKEIEDLLHHTTNTTYAETLFGVRRTHVCCVEGSLEEGEALLNQATYQTTFVCVDLLVVYMWVYLHLLKFERSPTVDNRSTVLMWAEKGLHILGCEDSDSYWRPMLLLKMVYCCLGLGPQSTIIPGCQVDEACEHRATELLTEIQPHYSKMSGRRKMLYHIAKARMCQLAYDYATCQIFLRNAMKLAQKENFLEVAIIADYQRAVYDLDTAECSNTSSHDQSQQQSLQQTQLPTQASRNNTAELSTGEDYHIQQPSTNTDQSSLDPAIQNAVHLQSSTNVDLSHVMFEESDLESTSMVSTGLKELKDSPCEDEDEETYLKQHFATSEINEGTERSDEHTQQLFATKAIAFNNKNATGDVGEADNCFTEATDNRVHDENLQTTTSRSGRGTNVYIRGELFTFDSDQYVNSMEEVLSCVYCQETVYSSKTSMDTKSHDLANGSQNKSNENTPEVPNDQLSEELSQTNTVLRHGR